MKSEGIILSSIDYKETSKIVHLYTPSGRKSVKALGASNPKKGLLGFTTTGNIVEFVASDADLPQLSEYIVKDSIYQIVEDFQRVAAFSVMLEVINSIPQDINHQAAYTYIVKSLIDLKEENPKKLLTIFLVKMLYVFGVAPNLKSCVRCNNPNPKFIDLSQGGAICENCGALNNQDELYIFREYYQQKKKVSEYTACNYDAMLIKLKEYYQRYTSIHLKLQNVLKKE